MMAGPMGFEAFTYHGGALEVARRLTPNAPTPWIDLSTGINPYPYPVPDLAPEVWTRLPEPEGLARLEAVAAAHYRGSPDSVVVGPGSQALIQALARLLPARRVCALTPTYGGFDEAFAAAGMPVEHASSLDALERADVAIVVNPNNPDGRVSPRAQLLDLHARLAPRGGMLIVDEAFADFDGADETLEPRLPASSCVVLRSFGKAYGLAGLRLGFAIASPDLVGRLRAALGPWPISGPAITIGARGLADSDWLGATLARLTKDKARLDGLLGEAGWRILGGTRLFSLAAREDAGEVFKRLLAAGILARPFCDAPDRLRFGVPAGEEAWRRLAAALGRPLTTSHPPSSSGGASLA
jgi:cobalamin biosynthetic protein CobC